MLAGEALYHLSHSTSPQLKVFNDLNVLYAFGLANLACFLSCLFWGQSWGLNTGLAHAR
jgi:hypothetical protein